MEVDILILGSGPAGAAAAITCAEAGAVVGLLTRENASPAPPKPLQSLHPGVLPLLEQLGLEEALEKSSRSRFSGIYVNGKQQPLSPLETETWWGFHIDRAVFDAKLLEQIKPQVHWFEGAEALLRIKRMEDQCVLVELTGGQSIRAKYLIDATGAQRKTKHFLQLDEKRITKPLICQTGQSKTKPGESVQTAFQTMENGWVWTAPDNEKRFTWTCLSVAPDRKTDHPFSAHEPIGDIEYYNLSWRVFRPVCDQQVLLCGDAAGMLDPAAGQGILNGLMSGVMAGHCVTACLEQPEREAFHFARYDQWFIEQFEKKVADLARYYEEIGLPFEAIGNKKTTTTIQG